MMQHARKRRTVAAVLVTISLGASAGAQTADSAASLNDRAMKLLREQKYTEAADAARRAVDAAGATAADKAVAGVFLAAAKFRLGDRTAATAALDDASRHLPSVAETHWVHREAAAIRGELAGKTRDASIAEFEKNRALGPLNKEELADLGVALWRMHEANASKQFARALEIADIILARPGENRAGAVADVLLHSYYAHRKLGDSDKAAAALTRFEEAARSLPEEDTLPIQMMLLRESFDGEFHRTAFAVHNPGVDSFWKVGEPAAVGMDPVPLAEHLEMCKSSGADAVLVARHGVIVSEWYSPLYREPVFTMSSVKSITALVAGLLVEDGKLNIDDPVSRYIPEWANGVAGRATVRHVLTMTAGLPKRSDMGVSASGAQGMNAYVRTLRPAWEPGTKWDYSNEGAQLMSPILEAAAGEPLWQYAHRRLFAPMGLTHTEFRRDSRGSTNTYADAQTTLREMARFGVLMINDGKWEGKQVVSREWVRTCITPIEQNAGYGAMWWLYEKPTIWAMEGYLNTSMWAFPEHGVVVCRVQSKPYLHAAATYDEQRMFKLIEAASPAR